MLLVIAMVMPMVPQYSFAEEEETLPVEEQVIETMPVETEPEETEPVVTEPIETEPIETEPVETEPAVAEPEKNDSTEAEEDFDPLETTKDTVVYSGTCGDNVTWTYDFDNDGTLTISGTGDMYDWVSGVHEYWFNNNYNWIFHAVITSGVTNIGEKVFSLCQYLKSIIIPDSVIAIGDGNFHNSRSLTEINVDSDNKCYSSRDGVLFNKSQTELLIFPVGKSGPYCIPNSVTRISNSAFKYCSMLKNITIPNSVTNIGDSAFYNCLGLTRVIIPNSVKTIGESAFYGCEDLTSITISDSVMSIGNMAFCGCDALTSITIPNSVTSIGYKAFMNCGNLMNITIPNSVTKIVAYSFCYCSRLVGITVPNGVTSIGGGAFYGCDALTSIMIPNSVTSIGDSAFYGCYSLTDVYYSGSEADWDKIVIHRTGNKCLDNAAIHYNSTSETYPVSGTCGDNLTWTLDSEGVLTISGTGEMCLGKEGYGTRPTARGWENYLSQIKSLVIENGATSIFEGAFSDCSNLAVVTIPNSVTSIGRYVFSDCSSMTSVTIPSSVTNIKEGTFDRCSRLDNVTIPNSVTSIQGCAFDGCSSLTDVYYSSSEADWNKISIDPYGNDCLKNAVIHYNSGAPTQIFWKLSADGYLTVSGSGPMGDYTDEPVPWQDEIDNIKAVAIQKGITTIGDCAFSGCKNLTGVYYGEGITRIGNNAFSECENLKTFTVSKGVTSIGEGAFYNCKNLNKVTFSQSVTDIGAGAFEGCENLNEIIIPDAVTQINPSTFSGCSGLDTVTLPADLKSVDLNAFSGCEALICVAFMGTREQWNSIRIEDGNDCLKKAIIQCSDDKYNLKGRFVDDVINVKYISSYTNADSAAYFYYKDSMFDRSKGEIVYQHDLAKLSLGATMSAVSPGKSDNIPNGDRYVRSFLTSIGCDDSSILTEKFNNNIDSNDTVAYAFACKFLPDGSYLVPVLIRSFGYGPDFSGEWASNFRVWDYNLPGYSGGFKNAADNVYAALTGPDGYVEKILVANGVSRDNIKIWIAGFSRGGAVSNLLGAKLMENNYLSEEKLFVYTFATPITVSEAQMIPYSNIFNIVSEQDIVPRVPLREWNYTRYGQTKYLASITASGLAYYPLREKMEEKFRSIAQTNYTVQLGQEKQIDLLVSYLNDVAHNPQEYFAKGIQNEISETLAKNGANSLVKEIIKIWMISGQPELALDILEFITTYNKFDLASIVRKAKQITADLKKYDNSAVGSGVAVLAEFFARYALYNLADTLSFDGYEKYGLYNDALTLLSDAVENKTASMLFMQHWPEAYLAWLTSGDPDRIFARRGHKIVSNKCPVDITVYASNGSVACRIVNDQVDKSVEKSLYAYTDGDEKYIYITDDDVYTTVVTAREDGQFSIVATDYSANGVRGTTVGYAYEQMTAGQTFSLNDSDVLTTNGETLTADFSYSGERQVDVAAFVSGPGYVFGAKTYNIGDTVDLLAMPEDNKHFVCWLDAEGNVVSTDFAYRFMAMRYASYTAVFCDSAELDIEQTYLALQPSQTGALTLLADEAVKPYAQWSAANASEAETEPVVSVDNEGNVTALRSGTAYVTVSVTVDGKTYSDRCRIDVVDGEEEHTIASNVKEYGADLLTPSAKVSLFSTDYTKVSVLLNLKQNMFGSSLSAMKAAGPNLVEQIPPEDTGAAIEAAVFANAKAAAVFDLRVVDDRTLEIVPKQAALQKPASVLTTYQSAITLTVDSETVTTDVLSFSVDKMMPTVKAAAVTINSFFPDAVPLVFIGMNAAQIEANGALPAGFELDEEAMTVAYTGTKSITSGTLKLWVVPEGWAVRVPVNVLVSVSRTEPMVKLSAASVSLLPGSNDSASVKMTVTPACETEPVLTLLNSAGKVTEDLTANYADGVITVSSTAAAAYGTVYKLNVQLPGTAKPAAVLMIKTLAAKAQPTLSVKAAGSIDSAIPNSPITLTPTIKNFHAGSGEQYSVTVLKTGGKPKTTVDATSQFLIQIRDGRITLTEAVPGTLEKGYTYTATVQADVTGDGEPDCTANAKLSLKWSLPSRVPISVTLKATGAIDVIRPGTSIRIVPTVKNWFGFEPQAKDLVFYTGSGKTIAEITGELPFNVSVEDGAYILTSNGANSTVKYSVGFRADVKGDGSEITAKPIALSVKMGSAKLTADVKAVTLLKKDRYDTASVCFIPADDSLSEIDYIRLDKTSAAKLEVEQLSGQIFALGYKAQQIQDLGKGITAKLEIFLKGNQTTKPNATVTVKVTAQ